MEKRPRYSVLIGLASVLILLAGITGGALYYLVTKSLPDIEGSSDVVGLSAPVNIHRDAAGFPHILASSEYDAYVAAGYVHAQDRLWQMDLLRRFGQGRLAEVLGPKAVPIDRLMRTIGVHRIADSLRTQVSEQTLRILSAYSTGVNAFLEEYDGRYPIEFDILQYEPEPWEPLHSLILTRLMGWELGLSWWVDLTLGALRDRLDEQTTRDLFPTYDDNAPRILPPDIATAHPGSSMQQEAFTAARHDSPLLRKGRPASRYDTPLLREGLLAAQRLLGSPGSAMGSNSWTVDSAHALRGKPLLANDPHLLYMQPARWYVMHLSAPGLNVAGVTVPGVPAVVIGHNEHIAWGMTNVMADDVDFFVEDVQLRDSTYRVAGRTLPLGVHTDSIFVRDSLPVVLQRYETARGPIISDVYPQRGVISKPSRFEQPPSISMRWSGQDASDEILALYRMNHAQDWQAFLAALGTFGVPSQNFTYADVRGNIGYTAAGNIPIRAAGVSPQLPNDGSTVMEPWTGYIPFERLPRSYNPDGGMLITANNKIVDDYPWHISSLWESEARYLRIRELLRQQRAFSAHDFSLMQMDVQSVYADTIRDAMVDALHGWPSRPVLLTRVMNRLAAWDCRMSTTSVEASIFNTAYTHLLRNTFGDEMDSTLFHNYVFLANIPTRVLPRLLQDTSTVIFDDVRTPGPETRQHILIRSITDAVSMLRERFGADMRRWEWGEMHTVTFEHPLGEIKPLDRIFNVGPIAIGGNNTTVHTGEFSFADPYEARVGPSMRFVADLASPDSSYIILTTGQSGQPFSDHYSDHTALWQSGATHRLIISTEAVRRSGWPRLELRPARQ